MPNTLNRKCFDQPEIGQRPTEDEQVLKEEAKQASKHQELDDTLDKLVRHTSSAKSEP